MFLLICLRAEVQAPHIKRVCVCAFWCTCVPLLGAGAGGGCVERRGPGPPHPDSPATGGEPVPPQQPVHQRPPERGGLAET